MNEGRDKLQIGWITPASQGSGIARVAIAAAEELAGRGYSVDIIRAESADAMNEPVRPTHLPILTPDQLWFGKPNAGYDLAVAHIGDHYAYHAEFLNLASRIPCLGVFHDFYLYDLFAGWLTAHQGGPPVQEAQILQTYGPAAAATTRRALSGEATIEEIARDIPMIEWCARQCVGALAHSGHYVHRLEASCPGPVAMAHLPWEGRGITPPKLRQGLKVRLLTAGVMNANKCADAVITAIGGSKILAERVEYTLAGHISDLEKARLEHLAKTLNYRGLTILGSVTDDILVEQLQAADIISCLRKPVLEGASASAIEGMLSGRPTIVADTGFYSELPDDLVFKVGAGIDPIELARVLVRLVGDETLRRQTGARAAVWAADHFSVSRYVDSLELLIEAVVDGLPVLRLGDTFGRQLRSFGLEPDDPSVGRIATALTAILRSSNPGTPEKAQP